jgi:glycosyltransferase involved in cell wall biosynthesis
MNTSICITVFNEEKSIGALLDSLLAQTKKADEIVIVDGGSTDKTVEIINHYQKRFGGIKLLKEKCSRSKGRNLGVEVAGNNIIAITDAGCIAHKDWLENITEPFSQDRVDISAGFYHMTGSDPVSKAMSVFLGVTPRHFDINFLPSTRSMAFRKSAWEEVGGFPESRENSAEDTDFNYKVVKLGLKYARVKSAIVEWGMPDTISDFCRKIYSYAKWDICYGIWWNPAQGLASHNIKALFVIVRYLMAVAFLICCFSHPPLFAYWLICLFAYLIFSFRKIFVEFGDWHSALWGPFLQITCDLAVMRGFISGIISG